MSERIETDDDQQSAESPCQQSENTGFTQDVGQKDMIFVTIPSQENEMLVTRTKSAEQVRPNLICCIVTNLNLAVDGRFRKFLSLQNRVHSCASLCNKRRAATIATHDLNKIKTPLTFTAKEPEDLEIRVLGRTEPETGKEYIARLTQEAQLMRQKKKRGNFAGIHQYLNLAKNLPLYPCLVDAHNKVLSLAPISNSETSKITEESTALLIEVSSPESETICKRVMQSLLLEMLALELGKTQNQPNKLNLEQVKVVDEEGHLLNAHPVKENFMRAETVIFSE